MLERDSSVRITAEGALNHPWLANTSDREIYLDSGIINTLRAYRA
jgi:hypothetical protein